MNASTKGILFTVTLVGALIASALNFWLMFQSGCAGDLKTGSYGDPTEALRIELIAMSALMSAMILYAMAYLIKSKENVLFRAIGAIGIMIAVFVISFVPSVYFQGLGVASCH